MWEHVKDYWHRFVVTFRGSEVIVWARIQWLFGAAFVAMQSIDISMFITDKQLLQGYIFANALITEMLRRRREDWGEGLK